MLTEKTTKKITRNRLIAILAAILMIVCGVLAYNYFFKAGASGGMVYDANAESYDASSIKNSSQPGIQIPGYGTVYFVYGEKSQQMTLYNPDNNDCLFSFDLYVDGDKDPFYESGYVKPGMAISEIKMNRTISKGEHTMIIKINTYAMKTKKPLNDAEVATYLIME